MKKNILLFGTLLTIFTLSLSTLNTVYADSNQKSHSFVAKKGKKKKSTKKEKEIYKDDFFINKFLNAYNKANPDAPVSSDMFKPYYHHGRSHKDQIVFENKNNCQVVVTGSRKMEVVITKGSSASDNDLRNEFIRFGKAFNSKLSDETLISYWEQAIQPGPSVAFDDFEVSHNGSYVMLQAIYAKRK